MVLYSSYLSGKKSNILVRVESEIFVLVVVFVLVSSDCLFKMPSPEEGG